MQVVAKWLQVVAKWLQVVARWLQNGCKVVAKWLQSGWLSQDTPLFGFGSAKVALLFLALPKLIITGKTCFDISDFGRAKAEQSRMLV